MPRRMMINFNKLCLLMMGATVVYNEYLCYYLASLSWPRLATPSSSVSTVLFVADPQIQGDLHEAQGILGAICRWDSDRYLGSVYSWVSAYAPTAIVFLGDLIDEGSESTREEFLSYSERFHTIFPPRPGSQTIYIPGDNDIGGEGVDPVTLEKVVRFDKAFGPSSLVYNVSPVLDIIPVSRLTEHGSYNLTNKIDKIARSKLVVTVSHVPVLPLNGKFAERVVNLLSPDIIFSAHDHRGFLFTADRQSRRMKKDIDIFSRDNPITPLTVKTRHQEDDSKSLVEMSDTLMEVVVPTCSYRMGVKEMGVGLAEFRETGDVVYHNLWLPARFSLLYTYVASLTSVTCLFLFGKFLEMKRITRRKSETSPSTGYSKLKSSG